MLLKVALAEEKKTDSRLGTYFIIFSFQTKVSRKEIINSQVKWENIEKFSNIINFLYRIRFE